jgi:hypothetical protein
MSDSILFKTEVYRIIGACLAVHSDKGNGYAEPVYQYCLEIELPHHGIPFDAQRNFPSTTVASNCATPTPRIYSVTIRSSSNSKPSDLSLTSTASKC